MCLNFKCIRLGFQDRRHRLRSRPMYVLFRYGIQTFYTAIIIITRNVKSWHGKLDIPDIVGSTQLSAILGTAHILRKVLCLKAAGRS